MKVIVMLVLMVAAVIGVVVLIGIADAVTPAATAVYSPTGTSALNGVLLSRQTPPVRESGGSGVLWLALALIVVASAVALMSFGRGLLREWRLARKRQARPQTRVEPQPPMPMMQPPQASGFFPGQTMATEDGHERRA